MLRTMMFVSKDLEFDQDLSYHFHKFQELLIAADIKKLGSVRNFKFVSDGFPMGGPII